jgi:hypothetical protein
LPLKEPLKETRDPTRNRQGRTADLGRYSMNRRRILQSAPLAAAAQEVVWEYPNHLLVRYSTLAHNSYGPNGHPGNKSFGSYGTMLQGTKGTLFIDRAGYEITPQMSMHREKVSQTDREVYDDLQGAGLYFTSETTGERGATSIQHMPHVRNFLDCLKSRQRPIGDVETAHKSTVPCLIGNIALRTGLKLHWDGAVERFTKMLMRPYWSPWKLPGTEA